MHIFTLSTFIIGTLGLLAAVPAAEPARPLAPTQVNLNETDPVLSKAATELQKQSGIPIEVPADLENKKCEKFTPLKNVPFWEALQTASDKSGTRIRLTEGGRKVVLAPRGNSREVATTNGSFRVVAQQVTGRALLDQGVTLHEVQLLVHWEPRVRVFRIDTIPQKCKAADAVGSEIKPGEGDSKTLPLGASSEMRVRLFGLNRKSEKITSLSGVFTVTAADKMLAFTFKSDGKIPSEQKQENVTVMLKRVQKKDDTWEVEVEATYPEKQPTFESFQGEWWLRDNKLTVISPQKKPFTIEDYEIPMPDSPRPLRVIYRFKENPKTGLGDPTKQGWSIMYETPSPLVEVEVPFELKDIPLP